MLDVIIRPMEFASFLSLPNISQDLNVRNEVDLNSVKLLLPLYTNGAITAEAALELDAEIILKIWLVVNDLNDFEYIKKRLENGIKDKSSKPITDGRVLASIASHFPAYTIADILHLPAQTILALNEDLKPEEKEEEDTWDDPTGEDIRRIMEAE